MPFPVPHALTLDALDGRDLWAVTMGRRVIVVDEGRPWLHVWSNSANSVPDAFHLSALHEEEKINEGYRVRPVLEAVWPLPASAEVGELDRPTRQSVAAWLMNALGGLEKPTAPQLENAGEAFAKALEQWLALPHPDALRQAFPAALAQWVAALHQVHLRVNHTVREALAPYELARGELIHWAMAMEGPARTYRIQALQQQPFFLPRALQLAAGTARDRTELDPQWVRQLQQRRRRLEGAIDRGQAWVPDLQAFYTTLNDEQSCRAQPLPGLPDVEDFRVVHARPAHQSLGWLSGDLGHPHDRQIGLVKCFKALSHARRPFSPEQGRVALEIMGKNETLEGYPIPWSDPFLKGMPVDWTHQAYQVFRLHLNSIADSQWSMESADDEPSATLVAPAQVERWWQQLTTLQWQQWAQRRHAWLMEQEKGRAPEAGFEWVGLCASPWVHATGRVVELTSEAQLMEEGAHMHHCVGSYGTECGMGWTRVFSVQDHQGRRLSTVALEARVHQGRPMEWGVVDHLGLRNSPPSEEARDQVEAFVAHLRAAPMESIEANDRAKQRYREERQRKAPWQRALHAKLWAEAHRRFPSITASVFKFKPSIPNVAA